ncbi:esterase EstA [Maricurvus nonylphenolicus]
MFGVFCGVSADAISSPYSELIVFGDSLLDSGQYVDPAAPGSGLRFTEPDVLGVTGQVNTQRLAELLGLGYLGPSTPLDTDVVVGTNYAVGGNRTDEILSSIVDVDGSVVIGAKLGGLGINTRNGYLVDNPRIDGNTLVVISGGANDIFQGAVTDAISAGIAANNLRVGMEALSEAGANYIMYVTLPTFEYLPLATTLSATPGAAEALVGALDLFQVAAYEALRNTSANIIPIDLATLTTEILQNPESYGFANLGSELYTTCYRSVFTGGAPCVENTTYGINSANPDPSKLLFDDAVHPTSAFHQILGDLSFSLLQAPAEVSQLPRMAANAVHSNISRLQQQLRVLPRGDAGTIGKWELLTNLEAGEIKYRNNFSAADAEQSHDMGSIGIRYGIDSRWSGGVMLDIFNDELKTGSSKYPMKGYGLMAFGQYHHQNWFLDIMAGVAHVDFNDVERGIQLGQHHRTETGSTDGSVYSFATEAIYNLAPDISQFSYGPRVNFRYLRSEVDGYSEKSQRSTSLRFYDQTQESLTSEIGAFMRFVTPNNKLTINTEVGLRHEYHDDAEMLRMSSRSLNLNSYELPGVQQDSDDELSLSISAGYRLSNEALLTASYQYVDGDDKSTSINIGMGLRF